MTEQEFARDLIASVDVLSKFIYEGSKAIITKEDKCTVESVKINATIGVCAQLIVSAFKKEDSDIAMLPQPMLDAILVSIKDRILESVSGTIQVEIHKDK